MKTPFLSVLAVLFSTVITTLAIGLLLSSTICPVKLLDTTFPKFKGVSTEFLSIPESLLQLLNKKGTNKIKINNFFDTIMFLF